MSPAVKLTIQKIKEAQIKHKADLKKVFASCDQNGNSNLECDEFVRMI